jgi:hypothetical protein
MLAILVAALLLIAGNSDAQYENPYAIKPIGSTYSTPTYTTPSYGTTDYTSSYRVTVPRVTVPSTTVYNPRRNSYSSEVSSYSYSNPATVVSPGGTYLGNTSANKYDPDSINNPYGQYGSKYSTTSVNNPYGQYGSKYSTTSSNNPYAIETPKLYGEGGSDYRGKLSANQYDAESVENKYSPNYDAPLAKSRQQLRTQLWGVYNADPVSFIKEYNQLTTAEQKAVLDLLTDD